MKHNQFYIKYQHTEQIFRHVVVIERKLDSLANKQ